MIDPADHMTLPLIPQTVTKKRGRPATGKARTAAQRKAEQRANVRTKIVAPESDGGKSSESWTLQECLYVLSDADLRDSYGKEAHKRIGVLLVKKICEGDGVGITECEKPARRSTGAGQTWSTWKCSTCGGVGRSTWD